MIIKAGTTTVSTSGTEVQLSNTTSRVSSIQVKALAANSGIVYFGDSDVTTTNGYELSAGNTVSVSFADAGGTVAFSTLYLDAASNGDKASWIAVIQG